jgi:hypothetical protein
MAKRLRTIVIALMAFWPATAQAAVDWCRMATLLPTSHLKLEEMAASIDAMGCRALPTQSAHFRMWRCSDRKADDTWIFLEREESGYDPLTVLTFETEYQNLNYLRSCPGIETSPQQKFDKDSIALIDQARRTSGQYGLDRTTISLFGLAGDTTYSAAGYPERGDNVVSYIEGSFFGYSRPRMSFSSVELAGKKLIETPVDEILGALQDRGAKIQKDESTPGGLYRAVTLSAPIGLEGVSEIAIQSMKRHVSMVTYTVPEKASYEALIAVLDQKYGTSERAPSSNAGCTVREWSSGSPSVVEILGEFCPGGSHIWYTNLIVKGQREAYIEHLERLRKSPRKPVIDRDNL